jgi:hypothetical protein
MKRILFIIARTIDYRIGLKNNDKPELPVLTFEEALISFCLRLIIILVEFITCVFVIANIIHHW